MKFRHDEIRDYKDNIRLDYGYAMTIASAQGLTVDRAFLLADDRPARETIYPAATRHREGLHIYVNRTPLAFDIADRRPEDQAERPVTDSDIREHLAERWSRSQPKEAALDYVSDGAWRERQDDPRRHVGGFGGGREETPEVRAAANDNAFARIAGEIRHAVIGWRHGAAVDAFAAERSEVLAAWGELRERTRAEGDTVALSPAFRETLDRHAALLKRASLFRTRPRTYERLLGERAGIGKQDLDEFKALHARAGKYRRSAEFRAAHAEAAERENTQEQRPSPERERRWEEMPAGDTTAAVETTESQTETSVTEDAALAWQRAYRQLRQEWNVLIQRADLARKIPFHMKGYDDAVRRAHEITGMPNLPDRVRESLADVLKIHERDIAARKYIEDYLAAGKRHIKGHDVLVEVAKSTELPILDVATYPDWKRAADRLIADGGIILSDERYHPHLENIPAGRLRAKAVLSDLGGAIEGDVLYPSKRETRQHDHKETTDRDQSAEQNRDTARRQRKSRGLSM